MTAHDKKLAENLKLSGGGGKRSSQKDDSNTLRSTSTAQVLFLLGEGQVEGVEDLSDVILDDTRVHNSEGDVAIPGVTMHQRYGLPTQTPIDGFDGPSNETPVGVKVTQASPVVRSLTDSDYTSGVVTIQIPALVKQTDKGLKKAKVKFTISVRYDGGPWVDVYPEEELNEKCTSPYEVQYRFTLPVNPSGDSHPWDVRVTRLSEDSDSDRLQNDIYFQALTGIIDVTMQYPDSALIGLLFDASEFSGSLPTVDVVASGMHLQVPSNYDPVGRTYSGAWDGTFKSAYSNNPAWFYWTVATNKRYGLGKFLDTTAVDKWMLYSIAQVCDEMVPDGYGGFEPRFELNEYITEEKSAYEMMQLIASSFRGMSYWGAGAVTATQDVLSTPKVLVTRSNVINGEFDYSSTSLTARHTVVHVRYRDKGDDYQEAIEVVRDADAIRRYGERIKEIKGFGITSRAAANRLGRWILYTELNEASLVSYQAGLDHAMRRPGDIINVMDPEQSNLDFGGRTGTGSDLTTIVLDRPVALTAGPYELHVTMPDGTLATRTISSSGTVSTVTLSASLPDVPISGAVWAISSPNVEPKPFRIISIAERERHVYEISAMEVYTPKYALIDADNPLDEPNYRDPIIPEAPTDLTAKEVFFYENGVPKTQIMFSWKAPSNLAAPLFRIEVDTPDATNEFIADNYVGRSYQVDNSSAGAYTVRVYSLSLNGRYRSTPATLTVNADGINLSDVFTVEDVQIVGEAGNEFYAKDVEIKWANRVPTTAQASNTLFQQNRIKVYDNRNPADPILIGTYFTSEPRFKYSFAMNTADNALLSATASRALKFVLAAQDTQGRWGPEVDFLASNPAPAAPSVLVNGSIGMATFETSFPVLKDVLGQSIHIDTVADFTPSEANRRYLGTSSFAAVQLVAGTYYAKVGLYDTFDDVPTNYTAGIGFTVIAVTIDTDAPNVPTGLALSFTPLGDGQTKVTATWTANTEPDLAYYDVQIKIGSGSFVGFATSTNTYEWRVASGSVVTVNVRAVDNVGNKSPYSADLVRVVTADNVPPAVPTGLTVTAGLDSFWLKWAANTEADFSHYEIYENTVDDSATATLIGAVAGNAVARSGLALSVTRHYWLKAVDLSGNKSAFSAGALGTTGTLPEIDTDVITMVGPFFSPATGGANRLTWSAGSISYGPPGAVPTTKAITAGFVDWTSGTVYVYYVKGNTTLSTTTNLVTMYASEGVFLGVYKGGSDFQLANGGAMINGNTILAGTIGSSQLVTGAAVITGTAQIDTGIITNAHIVDLSAAKLMAGTALAGTITVSGTALSTIASNAAAGFDVAENFNANNDRNGTTPTAPVVLTDGTAVDHVINTDGSASISFEWTYTTSDTATAANNIDGFIVSVYQSASATAYTPTGAGANETTFFLPRDKRSFILTSATANQYYTFAVSAYRTVDSDVAASGLVRSAFVKSTLAAENPYRPASSVAFAGDITGTVNGTAATTVVSNAALGAQDPATRINSGTTKIDPGQITISGSTTLANWRHGSDTTKITGGAIFANSITANKLEIGARGISVEGVRFTYNKATNLLSWTTGIIRYTRDDGTAGGDPDGYVDVLAGSVTWTTGTLFVYWNKGASDPANGTDVTLSTTTSAATANQANTLVLASYKGSTNFVANYGQTIIDGTTILTGTITATQIAADAITADKIAANAVRAEHVQANAITAKHMVLMDYSNLFIDYDFLAQDQYSGDPAIVTFFGTAVTTRGLNAMQILPAAGVDYSSYSPYARIEPNADFYAEASVATDTGDAANRAMIYVALYTMTSGGAYTLTRTLTIADKTNSGSTAKEGLHFTTAADERAYRIRFRRYAGSGAGYYGGVVIRRKANANLIVDGQVTAAKISVGQLSLISDDAGTVIAGMLRSSDSKMQVDLNNKRILIAD